MAAPSEDSPALALFGAGDRAFARQLLGAIAESREVVLDRAFEMYARNVGDSRTLSDGEFRYLFGSTLEAIVGVRESDEPRGFLDRCEAFGEHLATRGVRFSEFMVALYFFEDACLSAPGVPGDVRAHRAFDRLSHQLVASVSSAYIARRTGEQAALRASLERDASRLAPSSRTVFHGLVGRSAAMRRLYARISAAAPRHTTVLIIGETGTGKELCARALHELSPRRRGPFVPVNCAAIPREILASELFGHRRGAFTGAVADARGLIAAAERGTLFLDEVTEMDEAAQVALLRVLEQHTVRPVGSTGELSVDVRFVAATNRDPEAAVGEGKLREDLFHRIAATTIEVPPLRERMEDLPLLVDYFLHRIAGAEHDPVAKLAPDVMPALTSYAWPGNVRELANSLESAVTFKDDDTIALRDLPPRILRPRVATPSPGGSPGAAARAAGAPAAAGIGTVRDSERDLIRRAIEAHGGNKAAAARAIGISRKRLYAKLREMESAPPQGGS